MKNLANTGSQESSSGIQVLNKIPDVACHGSATDSIARITSRGFDTPRVHKYQQRLP
ncbi:MAG: hypothetical protein IPO04_20770 [Cytophagaceae bacterium]|nr:hypothetical protein [Cytophagaceae bacterium]